MESFHVQPSVTRFLNLKVFKIHERTSVLHSFVLLNSIPFLEYTTFSLAIPHLMELSWTMKIWTLMLELLLEHAVFLLSTQLERRLLNGRAAPCLMFWETCQTTVFQVTLPFYIPTRNARGEDNWRETTERKPFAGCLCRNSSTSSANGKLHCWQHASLTAGMAKLPF